MPAASSRCTVSGAASSQSRSCARAPSPRSIADRNSLVVERAPSKSWNARTPTVATSALQPPTARIAATTTHSSQRRRGVGGMGWYAGQYGGPYGGGWPYGGPYGGGWPCGGVGQPGGAGGGGGTDGPSAQGSGGGCSGPVTALAGGREPPTDDRWQVAAGGG